MNNDRLPTALWLDAQLRQFAQIGGLYTIINKGAHASGTILLKLFAPGIGAKLLQQQRDTTGALGWLTLFDGPAVEEAQADDYIRRAIARDPDLWVIEIEDRDLRNPFEGAVF